MASPLQEAAVQSIELDAFAKDIPDLIAHNDSLYSTMQSQATKVPVSNITSAGGVTRPSFRVPLRVQGPLGIRQGTGDGDSIGRGTGSLWDAFAVSPVMIFSCHELSFLSQAATEGRKRGLFDVSAQELKNSLDATINGLEGLMNGDGSGSIQSIPATATVSSGSGTGAQTSYISGLNSAAGFTDQQIVQFFPAVGGTARGNATISYVDVTTQTIWFSTALPSVGGATAVGDFIMVQGGSGAANSSILGLKAWQVNSNSGFLAGVNRALHPGRISTPVINAAGGALNVNIGTRAAIMMGRAMGPENESMKSAIWYGSADHALTISSIYQNVLIANASQNKGDTPMDLGKKAFSPTFCGREFKYSYSADNTRLDLISPSTWYLPTLVDLELYDFGGGQTVVSVPDPAGNGYLSSYLMAYCTGFNLVNSNPRAGAYVSNVLPPTV
jgi:hypothetical protein